MVVKSNILYNPHLNAFPQDPSSLYKVKLNFHMSLVLTVAAMTTVSNISACRPLQRRSKLQQAIQDIGTHITTDK
jgi:hypothetical protein